VAGRLPSGALHSEGKRMDPRKEAPRVLEKIVQGFGQKALGAEDGAEVRYLAYAKDTPLHGPINGLLG
jgi:hypothetical protein